VASKLSTSQQLFLGLVAGTLLGLFLGELAGFLDIVAQGYIQLLQMTVLPYVVISLITGLGSLTYSEARLLFTKVGALLLMLWSLAFVILFLMPLAFPVWESASFFSSAMLETPEEFDFLGLYIPANPFHSMANNMVPAVVLFSVATGIALIGVKKKERLIDALAALNSALAGITHFVVRLAPIGIFAIAANMAGTMSFEELGRLQVFFVTYILIAILVTFWLLPGLVSVFTPIGYREMLDLTKDALVTAFMTGNLFIVLPILTDASKELLRRHQLATEETDSHPEVIIPVSFNFPHTGKVLTLGFILFAAWFSEVMIPLADYPKFALTGLVSFFGSVTVAVPFLLDMFRIPADMFELFLATGILNARFGTLIAAMHTLTLALLGSAAVLGTFRLDTKKLLRYGVISVALTAMTIAGARLVFEYTLENEYRKDKVLAEMTLLRKSTEAKVFRETPSDLLPNPEPGKTRLEQIQERGFLRVGFMYDSLPYAYFNAADDLVGFDVDMAHQLAREMDISLEFVPIERDRLTDRLDGTYCDVIMSGIVMTTDRAADLALSASYLDETLAFIVRDHRRAEFSAWEEIQKMKPLKLGVPSLPYLLTIVRDELPNAELIPIGPITEIFEADEGAMDAAILTAERGSAWSLIYPQYAAAVPRPGLVSFPLVYPVAGRDEGMARFLSSWIDLKRKDGTIQLLYDHWILGKDAEPKQPRWSIIRNVLHWVP